jgi:ABC-2 type transport system ATP-binding protein
VAVDSISFTLPAGKVFGFVGPNGAGKTTTLRIMATLDLPDSGDVLVDGRSVVAYPEETRRQIGFMPDALPEHNDVTAHEYLDFFGRCYGLRGAALDARVREVEDFTGLSPFRGKTLAALSKGMRQRVCLARALAHDPAVLLLDEPAAGLDPRARIELRDMIHALAGRGKTLLVSSHILTELAEMCSGILIIERGRLLQTGTLDELAARQNNGVSAPVRVALRVLANEENLKARLQKIPGVANLRDDSGEWRFELDGGEDAANELLETLAREKFKPSSFHARRVTLEDIFMNTTKGELA